MAQTTFLQPQQELIFCPFILQFSKAWYKHEHVTHRVKSKTGWCCTARLLGRSLKLHSVTWCCFMCNKSSGRGRGDGRRGWQQGKDVSADAYPSTFSFSIWNTQLPTVSYICREERNMRCRQETLGGKKEKTTGRSVEDLLRWSMGRSDAYWCWPRNKK